MRYVLLALLILGLNAGCSSEPIADFEGLSIDDQRKAVGKATNFGTLVALYEGELTDDDEKRPEDSSRVDTFETTFRTDASIVIRMIGDGSFDTYLMVGYPDETAAGINDDCIDEGANVSCVDFIANQTGTYQILANAYDSKGRGAYTVYVYDTAPPSPWYKRLFGR